MIARKRPALAYSPTTTKAIGAIAGRDDQEGMRRGLQLGQIVAACETIIQAADVIAPDDRLRRAIADLAALAISLVAELSESRPAHMRNRGRPATKILTLGQLAGRKKRSGRKAASAADAARLVAEVVQTKAQHNVTTDVAAIRILVAGRRAAHDTLTTRQLGVVARKQQQLSRARSLLRKSARK